MSIASHSIKTGTACVPKKDESCSALPLDSPFHADSQDSCSPKPWLPLCWGSRIIHERRLLFKLIWKGAFVWVTPYLVQLTFSLEACSWKNGDLVFQRWSFFSILETCMGIDDPYVKKPRWRRNWNAISKMIKDGLAEGMVTRKLCAEVLDLVLTSFQTSFFFRASWIETCQLD